MGALPGTDRTGGGGHGYVSRHPLGTQAEAGHHDDAGWGPESGLRPKAPTAPGEVLPRTRRRQPQRDRGQDRRTARHPGVTQPAGAAERPAERATAEAQAVSHRMLRRLFLAALSAACGSAILPAAAPASAPPSLSVSGAILIEQSSAKVLYAVNPERRLAIASTTKLMTALITLEHEPKLSKVFVAPDYHPAAVDSQIGLSPGERMSVHDLLLGLLLPSGDDAAEDLAVNVGRGSVARFVGMMNARARELGLTHTHYSTP